MARKLKTYQTSLGFFDQAIAAPSMKAALEAWGADSNLFHQGAAKESDDPDVIAATMAKPGVVLKRPVGTDGPFGEDAGLPTGLGRIGPKSGRAPKMRRPKSTAAPVDKAAERKAALAYERGEALRAHERAKRDAAGETGEGTPRRGDRQGPERSRYGRARACRKGRGDRCRARGRRRRKSRTEDAHGKRSAIG